MRLIALATSLVLLAAPATALTLDRAIPTGVTSGPIGSTVAYEFGELFVDDTVGSQLSIFQSLSADGGFDLDASTPSDLLHFPGASELAGALVDIDFGASEIFALYEVTGDTFDGAPWGDFVRATIAVPGVDWTGGVDLAALGGVFTPSAGTTTLEGVSEGLSAIPLPATLPMLLAALGTGVLLRRRG